MPITAASRPNLDRNEATTTAALARAEQRRDGQS
jgi:hypothetical protein